jgi:hypothetical protein
MSDMGRGERDSCERDRVAANRVGGGSVGADAVSIGVLRLEEIGDALERVRDLCVRDGSLCDVRTHGVRPFSARRPGSGRL